jgi:hypothetical protein
MCLFWGLFAFWGICFYYVGYVWTFNADMTFVTLTAVQASFVPSLCIFKSAGRLCQDGKRSGARFWQGGACP